MTDEFNVVADGLGRWEGVPTELQGHRIRPLARVGTVTRPGRSPRVLYVLRVRHDPEECGTCRSAKRA